jgi:hypothetical protein
VNNLLQGNSYLQQRGTLTRTTLSGRQGYSAVLAGRSPITGRTELVTVYAAQLRNGDLFYIATVVPEQESSRYNTAFRSMLSSLRLTD